MRDMKSNLDAVNHIVPQVLSATHTPSAFVDVRGYDGAMAVVNWGAIAGAGDFGAALMESDASDGSGATAVAGADLQGAFVATAVASSIERVGYVGTKRYIGVVITKAGGTSIAAACSIVRGKASIHPLS